MKNKFLTKRPRNRLPGIVIYCSFLAYRCYMGRGVLRQMLNCPVNFTHIYCTVPISRASFSAIENSELEQTGTVNQPRRIISAVSIVFAFVTSVFTFVSAMFTFVSTVFNFLSTVFTFVSTVFTFVITNYCVYLRQFCVYLR